MIWSGPDGPLKPHTSSGAMPDLSRYEPQIAEGKSHQAQAFIGAYQSEKAELAVDRTIEKRFDEALRKAGDQAPEYSGVFKPSNTMPRRPQARSARGTNGRKGWPV